MSRIRELLAQVAHQLGLTESLLARAQRRYKANRKRAYQAHNQQVLAQGKADRLRAKGHLAAAAAADRQAARAGVRAAKNHARAQYFLGAVKRYQQRIHGLEVDQASLDADLRQWKKEHGVEIHGNKVTGGTPAQRLVAAALRSAANCASGKRANFYSQAGTLDVDHCITGERYGERSDCSSWFTSVFRSCGLRDPNGGPYGGTTYTGTLVENGEQIEHPEPGCAVIYGSGPGHHVEMYVGPGNRTIGHGSAPVDAGVIDLFGDGDYRFFKYPTH